MSPPLHPCVRREDGFFYGNTSWQFIQFGVVHSSFSFSKIGCLASVASDAMPSSGGRLPGLSSIVDGGSWGRIWRELSSLNKPEVFPDLEDSPNGGRLHSCRRVCLMGGSSSCSSKAMAISSRRVVQSSGGKVKSRQRGSPTKRAIRYGKLYT